MVRQEKEPRGRNWEWSHGVKEQFRLCSIYRLSMSWQQDAGEHVQPGKKKRPIALKERKMYLRHQCDIKVEARVSRNSSCVSVLFCPTWSLTAMTTEVRSLSSSFSMISFFRVRLNSLDRSGGGEVKHKQNMWLCSEPMNLRHKTTQQPLDSFILPISCSLNWDEQA